MKEIKDFVCDIELELNIKLLFISNSGSKLFGTDNENSDTDYHGVFISSIESVILKEDIDHWNNTDIKEESRLYKYANNNKSKNTSVDFDIKLISVYKLFKMLEKGNLDYIEMLFSIQNALYKIPEADILYDNRKLFLSKQLINFTNKAIAISTAKDKKIKRYNEIKKFNEHTKNSEDFLNLDLSIFDYINYCKNNTYIDILGMKFDLLHSDTDYLKRKSKKIERSFGENVKNDLETDWKSLSHALRVVYEIKEILKTQNLVFPLKERDTLTKIKEKQYEKEFVDNLLNKEIELLGNIDTKLPENLDRNSIENFRKDFLKKIYKVK